MQLDIEIYRYIQLRYRKELYRTCLSIVEPLVQSFLLHDSWSPLSAALPLELMTGMHCQSWIYYKGAYNKPWPQSAQHSIAVWTPTPQIPITGLSISGAGLPNITIIIFHKNEKNKREKSFINKVLM